VFLLVVGCEGEGDALAPAPSVAPRAAAAEAPSPTAIPESEPPLSLLEAELSQDAILVRLADAPARTFEPVGSTSVVFRMDLEGTVDAAFKPRTLQHRWGHKAEVAAYRVARLLALDNVPPAITRRIPASELRERLVPEFHDAWDEIHRWTVWDDDEHVTGAAIYWVPGMRSPGLDAPGGIAQLRGWLSQGGSVPADRAKLAADISTMLAFDYLIGNWDRWSGGNVQGTAAGDRLFIRDHNAAFASPLPISLHRRLRAHLHGAERFSRRFLGRLAQLDGAAVREELSHDPGHASDHPILTDAQLSDMMDRRAALLSYVGALIAAHGEAQVVAFP
jgi:hypothetical protein